MKGVCRMHRKFNITGYCNPDRHYMVDLTERLIKIKKMIDEGEYFVINRARQYGKTTTLKALARSFAEECMIISISFEGLGESDYAEEQSFCVAICDLMQETLQYTSKDADKNDFIEIIQKYSEGPSMGFRSLSKMITEICSTSEKHVILMIDEVDQAGNYPQFLSFLGVLRNKYLNRDEISTFQSVILAGVHDIKNLKLKMRQEDEHQYNSPWNIAANFNIDMSFSVQEIEGMLAEYESEHSTNMRTKEMAELLYDYTSGYPFLVSRICKMIDEELSSQTKYNGNAWKREGILEAVRNLLIEKNTLFDSLDAKIANYPELKNILFKMLFSGETISYYAGNAAIEMALMFGFIAIRKAEIVVANKIFETRLYNQFLGEETVLSDYRSMASVDKNQFIREGKLDMDKVLEKFVEYFSDIYGNQQDTFVEENGRRLFLLYLRPIINGTGNYYIEAQTRDRKRTDVIVDYLGQRYVIEMKIWHGEEYNKRGEKQLAEYLDYYHLQKGYMVSFNFNKEKMQGVKRVVLEDKQILEVVV